MLACLLFFVYSALSDVLPARSFPHSVASFDWIDFMLLTGFTTRALLAPQLVVFGTGFSEVDSLWGAFRHKKEDVAKSVAGRN